MRFFAIISFTALVPAVFAAAPASACTQSSFQLTSFLSLFDVNKRVSTLDDCSFENAGADDNVSGQPVVALGNGYISQVVRIDSDDGCFLETFENWVVTDCVAEQAITVDGVVERFFDRKPNEPLVAYGTSVSPVVEQLGELPLEDREGLEQIRQRAENLDVVVWPGNLAFEAGAAARHQIDRLCGCKLFYPDTSGAEN